MKAGSSSDNATCQTPVVWRGLERVLGIACALVLTAMMMLTGCDVIARYVLNSPIQGAFELTEIFLVCLVFLAMPLAMLSNSHVEVELWQPMTKVGDTIRVLLGSVATLLVFGGLAWQLLEHAGRLQSYGSVSESLEIPLNFVAWIAMAGCLLGAIIALRNIVARVFGLNL